jgi:hypothetical protein
MYGERQDEEARVARWLAEREQRIQALEAENRALRLQLERLRQGIGIALVIDGRVVPIAPSSPGITASAPVPAVAPAHQSAPAHQAAPAQQHAIPHPPRHATGPESIPHTPRPAAARPTWPPLAETPAQLPAVGPLTPTGPVSAIGQWAASPPRATGAPATPLHPEPRWFDAEALTPAARQERDAPDANFLL